MAKPPVPLLTPLSDCLEKKLAKHPSFIMGTRHRFCLSLSSGCKFPPSTQNYSNKPEWLATKGPSILLLLQSLPSTVSASLLWVETPYGPAWHAGSSSPKLWVYVTSKLSSVLCHVRVLRALSSWTICVKDSSLTHGMNSWLSEQKIQDLKILALIQTMRLLPKILKALPQTLLMFLRMNFIVCADHHLEFSSFYGLYAFPLHSHSMHC